MFGLLSSSTDQPHILLKNPNWFSWAGFNTGNKTKAILSRPIWFNSSQKYSYPLSSGHKMPHVLHFLSYWNVPRPYTAGLSFILSSFLFLCRFDELIKPAWPAGRLFPVGFVKMMFPDSRDRLYNFNSIWCPLLVILAGTDINQTINACPVK